MRLSALALIGLTAVAIALALWTIGGPWQARSEQRDSIRQQDLQALFRQFDCLLRDGKAITDQSDACPTSPRDKDPFTGELYRMENLSDRYITLCADFENHEPAQRAFSAQTFDTERGCIIFRRSD